MNAFNAFGKLKQAVTNAESCYASALVIFGQDHPKAAEAEVAVDVARKQLAEAAMKVIELCSRQETPLCEHAQEFLAEIKAIGERRFVTLDQPVLLHCHVCSGIFKIPTDLLRARPKTTDGGATG